MCVIGIEGEKDKVDVVYNELKERDIWKKESY
jgi:hypothetical protein